MASVLINDTVKRYLLKQTKSFRDRIRQKFEYLETGIWEGRLRAKKLKGVSSKCVFEAPLDKDLRVLFTLGPQAKAAGKDFAVYVWGIATHDDLSRKSRLIAPGNAPFLGFREFDEALLEDVVMEDMEPAFFTQEGIADKARDESGQQRWYPVAEPEWGRIRRYDRDEFELFLCLSPEQRRVLAAPLPLLVSGTAGSGKTTLAVYYLLAPSLRDKTKIFITYNRFLKEFAERLYAGLANASVESAGGRPPEFHVFKDFSLETAGRFGKAFDPGKEVDYDRFCRMFASHPLRQKFDPALVWEEIRSILKGALPQVDTSVLERGLRAVKNREPDLSILSKLKTQFGLCANLASLAAVGGYVERHLKTDLASFCAQMDRYARDETRREGFLAVLERTLAEIHRQKGIGQRKHLTFLEYEFLGKKKAPHFPFSRKEIFSVVEWYQDRLDAEGLWDELDLTREVLKVYSENDEGIRTYDVLASDEVQDFADVQIDLLLAVAADPRRVFLAGDTKQTINPSGFRWEEVKRLFHERGLDVPVLHSLTLNFRSSGSIVELANVLLDLKEECLGVRSGEVREEWKYMGRPAIVVAGIAEDGMLDVLKAAGARRTILVRTEDERRRLRDRLATELVFTIGEAKGLEFDTVVLWKFCADRLHEDVWKVVLDLSRRSVHEASIRREINLLYVGVTRSRTNLIVYDGERPSVIWADPRFEQRVYATGDRDYVRDAWDVPTTPEAWVEQGRYFLDRNFYRAAMECFRNGDDERSCELAAGCEAERTGRYLEAAAAFEKFGEIERAARDYDLARAPEKSLPLWEKLGDRDRVVDCRIEICKREGRPAEAGRLHLERRQFADALRLFREAGDFQTMADVYLTRLKDVRQAAAHFELAQDFGAAARLYGRLGMADKAAGLYARIGDWAKAEKLWKKTGDSARLLELYEKNRRYDKMLPLYEAQANFEKAVKCLKMMKDADRDRIAREAQSLFYRRKFFPALVRFSVLEDHAKIAACHLGMNDAEQALRHFRLGGDYDAAGEIHLKRREFMKAVECFLGSERDRAEGFPRAKRAMRNVRDIEKIYTLGFGLFKQARYEAAAVVFSSSPGACVESGLCQAMMGNEEKAFRVWDKIDRAKDLEMLAEICPSAGAVESVAKYFLRRSEDSSFRSGLPVGSHLKKSRIVGFMDAYFSSREVPEDMARWGRFLGENDFDGDVWEKTVSFLDKGGDVNALLTYAERLGIFNPAVRKKVLMKWRKDLPSLKAAGNREGSAYRYYALGKKREFNEVLPGIELRPRNYALYLVAEKEFYEKGAAWCLDHGLWGEAAALLSRWSCNERAAEIFERGGDLFRAAEQYSWVRKPERAARLFEKLEKYGRAGDEYARAGEFQSALKMYEMRTPRPKKKIARVLERAGDLDAALKLWRELGDKTAIARCLRKAGIGAQPELPFSGADGDDEP